MFLSDADCNDALSHIHPPAFLPILQTASPSGEVVALGGWQVLLRGGTQRRLVDFGVAAIDLQLLYAGCLFEFADVEGFH